MVDHNCVSALTVEKPKTQTKHIVFKEDEISILWANAGDKIVDMILLQCYTGMRPSELCNVENCNIFDDHIIAGMKTEAGTNRYIPLHTAIKPIVEKRKKNTGRLFGDVTYHTYSKGFDEVMERLGLDTGHRPHDPRKTFITLAKKYGCDEFAIKYIVGHAINDLTEKTYTDRDEKWLNDEIEKIKMKR